MDNGRDKEKLQAYKLSDKELYGLCRPTIEEIKDVLGNDWRKTIVFAKGMSLNGDMIDIWTMT